VLRIDADLDGVDAVIQQVIDGILTLRFQKGVGQCPMDTWSNSFLRLSKSLSKSTISEKNLLPHRRFVLLYQQRCTPVHGGAESNLYSSWVVSYPVVSFQISDVGYGVSECDAPSSKYSEHRVRLDSLRERSSLR